MSASIVFAHSRASVMRSKVAVSGGNPRSRTLARYVVPLSVVRFSMVAMAFARWGRRQSQHRTTQRKRQHRINNRTIHRRLHIGKRVCFNDVWDTDGTRMVKFAHLSTGAAIQISILFTELRRDA